MSADPRRIKELFGAALDLRDAEARCAFLEHECSDDAELRERLDSLLAAHDDPDSAVERPFAVPPDADLVRTAAYVAPAETVGAVVADRYKLMEQIGEGGFGLVF